MKKASTEGLDRALGLGLFKDDLLDLQPEALVPETGRSMMFSVSRRSGLLLLRLMLIAVFTTVGAAAQLVLTPVTAPVGTVGTAYGPLSFSTAYGTPPYTYTLTAGSLPPGLVLNNGVIAGTPTVAGTFNITVKATDSNNLIVAQSYVLIVNPAQVAALSNPIGVAIDGSGNLYIADYSLSYIVKVPAGCAATSCEQAVGSGFSAPKGIAVDGSGNVYVIMGGASGSVVEIPWNAGNSSYGAPVTLASGLNLNLGFPAGVAVDGGGNVYFTDSGSSRVLKLPWNGSGYGTQTTVFTGTGGNYPTGIAVDGSGNIYISDAPATRSLTKVAPNGVQTTLVSTNAIPYSVAVDGSGNVYYSDGNTQAVIMLPWTGTAFAGSVPLGSGLTIPYGLTVDGSGNVYVVNSGTIVELALNLPSGLIFAATNVGSTSSSQTVTLENIGTAALSFPVPASGNNPSIAANFTLSSAGSTACPLLTSTASTVGSLAQGTSCTLPISFVPTAAGSISGSLVLTDNNLNQTSPPVYVTQTIPLSGTATDSIASFTITGLSNAAAGTPQTITVTAKDTPGNTYTSYTGTVHFTSTDGSAVLPANATLTNGASVFTVTLKTAGSQSVTVTDTATASATGTESATMSAASAGTISVVSGSSQSAAIGSAFASALTVKVVDAYSNPVAGAAVTFAGPASGAGALFSTSAATAGNGTASVTATANGTAGTSAYTVTASVAGVSTPASFSLTNTKALTNVTVLPTTTNIVYGQPVTVNAAVSPNSIAGSVPSGPVIFYDGATALSPTGTLASAAASYTVSVPAVGSHTYGAQYAGDGNFSGSVLTPASSAVVIGKASSTLTPAVTSQMLTYNSGGTIPVNVAGQFPGAGTAQPTGRITYTIGTGPLQTAPMTNGIAAVTISASQAAGTFSITVNYAGDGNYTAATAATISLSIKQATTAITWPAPAAITYGTVLSSTQLNATANVAGSFSYAPAVGAALAAGTQALGVTFTPTDTADFGGATSSVTLTVNKQATSIALASSVTSITPGQPVSFTATVVPVANGSPSGTVSFYDGSTLLATSGASGGTAGYSTTALLSGTHTISAIYSGDTNYLGAATASSVGVAVASLDFTLTGTGSSYQTVVPGSAVSFVYQIAPLYGAYSGTVSFTVSGCPPGATCTFSQNNLAANAGAQTVTLTVQTAAATAQNRLKGVPWSLALLMLPLVGAGSMRRSSQRLRKTLLSAVFVVVSSATLVGLSGCGSGNGFLAQQPTNYTLTVTAISGTIQHVSTTTLNLQ